LSASSANGRIQIQELKHPEKRMHRNHGEVCLNDGDERSRTSCWLARLDVEDVHSW
jgi:hypothetical protein